MWWNVLYVGHKLSIIQGLLNWHEERKTPLQSVMCYLEPRHFALPEVNVIVIFSYSESSVERNSRTITSSLLKRWRFHVRVGRGDVVNILTESPTTSQGTDCKQHGPDHCAPLLWRERGWSCYLFPFNEVKTARICQPSRCQRYFNKEQWLVGHLCFVVHLLSLG